MVTKTLEKVIGETSRPYLKLFVQIERFLDEKESMGLIQFWGSTYRAVNDPVGHNEYYFRAPIAIWEKLLRELLQHIVHDTTKGRFRLQWDQGFRTDNIIKIGWKLDENSDDTRKKNSSLSR